MVSLRGTTSGRAGTRASTAAEPAHAALQGRGFPLYRCGTAQTKAERARGHGGRAPAGDIVDPAMEMAMTTPRGEVAGAGGAATGSDEAGGAGLSRRAMGLLLLGGLGAGRAAVAADPFPSKPIRIIVPFGPGSGSDTATRIVAQQLATAFRQSVVTENRPGANGSIAAVAAARAAADGHTLLLGTGSTHGANSGLMARMPYDPLGDFAPIGMIGVFSSFLVIHPSIPAQTPAELVAYARAHPGTLSYATGNTSSLIMAEMFSRELGIDLLRVTYPSNPPGVTDVIAGRVSMMFPDISTSHAHVRAGTLRALAVITPGERSALAPELPTVSETVLPGFNYFGWVGLFAPAGTPPEIVAALSSQLQATLALPDVVQRFLQLGAEVRAMAPPEFRQFVQGELTRQPALLEQVGIRPQ
jgi:tripartite-type tricarboxylate transporter receptor subunit TctC